MRRRARARLTVAAAVLVIVTALGAALAVVDPARAQGSLTQVVAADNAIGFALHRASKVLYVVEQNGYLRPLDGDRLGEPALDLSAEVSDSNEQGLLGAAFSPDGTWLYTDHTNLEGDTEITAWPFANGRADAAKRRRLLSIDQPYANHNGGHVLVDSSGVLWIGMGDGGSAGDPQKNGQNRRVLLGKILRITPTPAASKPYAIPKGNLPSSQGRPEIWAYGLRNPWRFDVDEQRGRVWIADVGQGDWEEIDVVPLATVGANLGWSKREGKHAYGGGSRPKGAIDPVHEYSHGDGRCSVTGGVATDDGDYLFSDFCGGRISRVSPNGTVRSAAPTRVQGAAGFGRDANGAIYVAGRGSGVYRLS